MPQGWYGLICTICFETLTLQDCYVDQEGVRWDFHPGECADETLGMHWCSAPQREHALRSNVRLARAIGITTAWATSGEVPGPPFAIAGSPATRSPDAD